jgi:hypothetical protein
MANEKYKPTDQQRTALKPVVDKLESAFNELDSVLASAGFRRESESGICMKCLTDNRPEICSSFDGPGKTAKELCKRDFCKHPNWAHVG